MAIPNFVGTGLGGGATVTPQATTQTWPTTFTTTDPGGVSSWVWTAPDGTDQSASLTAGDGDMADYVHPGLHTIQGLDGSGNVLALHEIQVGNSDGSLDFPLDGGTLQDPGGTPHVVSRTATSITITDIATPADADRPVVYRTLNVAPTLRYYAAGYTMDAAMVAGDVRAISQMLITAGPTDIPNETKTFGGGFYKTSAGSYSSRLRIGTSDTSSVDASGRGGICWARLDSGREVLGDVQGQTVDINDEHSTVHAEADWNGTDLAVTLHACARVYSVANEGVGPKPVTGKWKIWLG